MKAIIKSITVEGTPQEIAKLIALSYPQVVHYQVGNGFAFNAQSTNSYKWKNDLLEKVE